MARDETHILKVCNLRRIQDYTQKGCLKLEKFEVKMRDKMRHEVFK